MQPIFVFGTSGYAREVADVADALGREVCFIAAGPAEAAAWIGGEEVVLESSAERFLGKDCAIGIGDAAIRRKLALQYDGQVRFPALVHPAATFGKRQLERIGGQRGVVIAAGVRFMNRIEVGDFASFDLNATIGHDAVIGAFSHVAPGATIAGHVQLGEGVWIGSNATVNQGTADRPLRIGAATVIGSGAVVTRDCAPDSVYMGVPARKVR